MRRLAVGLGYVALSLLLSRAGPDGTRAWAPQAGLDTALILVCGPELVPFLLFPPLLRDVWLAPAAPLASILTSLGLALAHTGAALALRFLRVDLRRGRMPDVGIFFATTGIAAAVVGLAMSGPSRAAVTDTVAEFVGFTAVTPFVIVHVAPRLGLGARRRRRRPRRQLTVRRGAEVAGQAAAVLFGVWLAGDALLGDRLLVGVCFLPIVWVAVRGRYPAATSAALATVAGVGITVALSGPVSATQLSDVQLFMAATTTTGLTLGAAVSGRRRAERTLNRLQAVADTRLNNLSVDSLLDELLGRVQRLLSADAAAVLLVGHDGEHLYVRAARGLAAETVDLLRVPVSSLPGPGRDGPVLGERLHAIGALHGALRSTLAARVEARNGATTVIGVVWVAARQLDAFSLEDGRLLELAADRVAAAVVNAQLYDVAQHELERRSVAEGALFESEARFRRLAENAPDMLYRYRLAPSFAVEYVSPAVATMLGYRPEEFAQNPSLHLAAVHPDDRYLVQERLRHPERNSEPLVVRRMRRDGSTIWTEDRMVPIHDPGGAVVAVEGIIRDVTRFKKAEAELVHRALHDGLTGLPNRSLFLDHLSAALARLARGNTSVAVLFLDLDRFKIVNDSLGHSVGDKLLQATADRLRGVLRPGDVVARFGGDEFAVLLEGLERPAEAIHVAERIQEGVGTPIELEGQNITTSTSIGIAFASGPSDAPETLLRHADAAMYQAKDRGRGCYEIFDDTMRAQAVERLHLENALRRALDQGELSVVYQPEIDIRSGSVAGVEALLRWQHPTRGELTAGHFIEVAEDTGLIVQIGLWVLEQACLQAETWRRRFDGRAPGRVWVNLSPRQLAQPNIVEAVAAVLERTGTDPSRISLEITETAVMADAEASLARLRALNDLGIKLAIDDFGTGYSSLAYLSRFPVDALKVDRSFVHGLSRNPEDTAIVTSVINMAHTLDLTVIAEGVETASQFNELRLLGCDCVQGNYIAPALPPERIARMLGP